MVDYDHSSGGGTKVEIYNSNPLPQQEGLMAQQEQRGATDAKTYSYTMISAGGTAEKSVASIRAPAAAPSSDVTSTAISSTTATRDNTRYKTHTPETIQESQEQTSDSQLYPKPKPPLPMTAYTSLYTDITSTSKHPPTVAKKQPKQQFQPKPVTSPASLLPPISAPAQPSEKQQHRNSPVKQHHTKKPSRAPMPDNSSEALQAILARNNEKRKQQLLEKEQQRQSAQRARGFSSQPTSQGQQSKRLSLSTAVPDWLHGIDAQYKQLLMHLMKASEGSATLAAEEVAVVGPFLSSCCARSVQLTDAGQHEAANAVLVRAEELSKLLQALPECEHSSSWLQLRAAVLNNLGYYFKARNKMDTAYRWLQQARQMELSGKFVPLAPESTLLNLGAVLSKLGRHEEALKQGQEAQDMLGKALAQQLELAEQAATKGADVLVLQQEEQEGQARSTLASVLEAAEEEAAAGAAAVSETATGSKRGEQRPLQRQHLEYARLLAMARHNVAVELEHLGRHEDAVAAMSTALQLTVAVCGKRDPMARQFSEGLLSLRKRTAQAKAAAAAAAAVTLAASSSAPAASRKAARSPSPSQHVMEAVPRSTSPVPAAVSVPPFGFVRSQSPPPALRPRSPAATYLDEDNVDLGKAAGQLNKQSHTYTILPEDAGVADSRIPLTTGGIASALYPDCLVTGSGTAAACEPPTCPDGDDVDLGDAAGQQNKDAGRTYSKTPHTKRSIASALYPDCLFSGSGPAAFEPPVQAHTTGSCYHHSDDHAAFSEYAAQVALAGAGHLQQVAKLSVLEGQMPMLLQQEIAALGFNRATKLSPLEQSMLQRSIALEAARRV